MCPALRCGNATVPFASDLSATRQCENRAERRSRRDVQLHSSGLCPLATACGSLHCCAVDGGGHSHCGLMLAALITLPHFSVSSAMSLPKSAGEPPSTVPSRLASRALNFGSASAALISLLSLSTISAGVFRGAPRPKMELAS